MTIPKGVCLFIGIGAVSMGVACMSYALLMLFKGDSGGLPGLALGVVNIYFGCKLIHESEFLSQGDSDGA